MGHSPGLTRRVCLGGSGIISALGGNTEASWQAFRKGQSALRREEVPHGYACPVARIDPASEAVLPSPSRFGRLALQSLREATAGSPTWNPDRSLLILCSAKGNVEALLGGGGTYDLATAARELSNWLGLRTAPLVISQACASGLVGLTQGYRLLRSGRYDRVAVVGCDVLSSFTLLGFQCVKALSPTGCRPFHPERDGTSLGEAAAAVILELRVPERGEIYLSGAAINNDADHVSRPRQDGQGLGSCIQQCTRGERPDVISLHGTGTQLNDSMELAALTVAGLSDVPTYGCKSQLGHTLGACGVIETILAARDLQQKNTPGSCLKTAAGFGGTNAAILLKTAP